MELEHQAYKEYLLIVKDQNELAASLIRNGIKGVTMTTPMGYHEFLGSEFRLTGILDQNGGISVTGGSSRK